MYENEAPRRANVRSVAASAGGRRRGGATGHAPVRHGGQTAQGKRAASPRTAPKTGVFALLDRITRRRGKRRPANPANVKAAMWLWFFPVGLSLMWRSACTWHKGVKIGITAAMAAILAAIFIIPTPGVYQQRSGVQMVSGAPEVEVYGPELPSLIVPGYTRESTGSIIVDQVANDVHYVYAADGARCYHEFECKFAFASSQRLTVYEAYLMGFEPCGRCNPPVYTPGDELLAPSVSLPEGAEEEAATEAAATEAVNAAPTATVNPLAGMFDAPAATAVPASNDLAGIVAVGPNAPVQTEVPVQEAPVQEAPVEQAAPIEQTAPAQASSNAEASLDMDAFMSN